MISIVIPTHGPPDAFAACIESVRTYTTLDKDVEVIAVINGGTFETLNYCHDIRTVWYWKALGRSECYNAGWREARGDIIIMLDDDCVLLPQEKDAWIELLTAPFRAYSARPTGATSPFAHHYRDIGTVVHSGCTAYSREAIEKVGGWDNSFGKQFFMDCDISARISKAGYDVLPIGSSTSSGDMFSLSFPVYHPGKDRQGLDSKLFMRNYEKFYHNNSKFKPSVSVIVPTYRGEHLEACINSIIRNTTSPIEIVVVANGLPQDKTDWVFGKIGEAKETDNWRLRLLLHDSAIGFPAAVNDGIRNSDGEYIVLMNDDAQILDWGKDMWLGMLLAPLADKTVGVTGPVKFSFKCGATEWNALGFSLVAIPKIVFKHIGLLDEIFTPGAGEDGDFSIRAQVSGYSIVRVPTDVTVKFGEGGFDPQYPLYHVGSATWASLEGATETLIRNKKILDERWGNTTL